MSDYWKKSETQPDIDTFLGFWDGCVHCACDHGCNQWLQEQNARVSLVMRAMRMGAKKKTLDRLVQMPLERANKLWFWIGMRDSKEFNKALREKDSSAAIEKLNERIRNKRLK